MKEQVSIIISTKNEENYIERLLLSIKKQTYKNVEIIIVDNMSTDRTVAIAKKYTKLIFSEGPERSAQRNFGASNAKGKYYLFIDADMELSPDVVSACVTAMQNKKIKAVIIPEESKGIGFWAQCKALERSFYLGVPWIEAARFFSKEVFQKTGGYNIHTTGTEDYDLYQTVKNMYGEESIGRIDSFIYHNEGKLSLFETIKKKYYYSLTIPAYLEKQSNQQYFVKQGNILNRYTLFFSNPQRLFQNPILGIGMLFMKTSEFTAGGVGLLLAKTKQKS